VEIIFRAAAMFLFLWLVTRIVGRSTLGELSTFQLILFITMGDMVQQAITAQDYSFTGGVLAVSVFTLLTIALSWANVRWPRMRAITHGVAVVVVDGGEPVWPVMRRERLSLDDLKAAARQKGFRTLVDVRLAVLEANGQISFFPADDGVGAGDGSAGGEERPTVG